MAPWTALDIPSQRGRTAVVTGTGGLGFETSLALAHADATVIVAGRSGQKGTAAVEEIRRRVPAARVTFEVLDLASLESIHRFGERLRRSCDGLALLVNNAGVMTPPQRKVTADGFELQLGTNHLGHFALTAGLLPLLRKSVAPRVVTVSSIAARSGSINFYDLQADQTYEPMAAYRQSKLACLLFALELQRRSDQANWGITSIAAHPGISRTELLLNGPGRSSVPGLLRRFMGFLFQPPAHGALPTLFAATALQAKGGGYYGPNGLGELRGLPAEAAVPPQARDARDASRLWSESEYLTGFAYPREGATPTTTLERSANPATHGLTPA